jgi:uncharacterized protein (UPF0264 family)
MTQLLVSVRNAAEATAALRGGADLIDVKEPTRGALGRADDGVLAEVVKVVAGRVPVSVALGELSHLSEETSTAGLPASLAFAKWGLAGCRNDQDPTALTRASDRFARRLTQVAAECVPVAAAYADYRLADAPDPRAVCDWACRRPGGVFLIDTYTKDGRTLADWIDRAELARLVESLIAGILKIGPDWIAVRGAACVGGRNGTVDEERVRRLKRLLDEAH